MAKAELIENPQNIEENPQETGLSNVNRPRTLEEAIEDWETYLKICDRILDDSDYQEFEVKEKKNEDGEKVKVKKRFRKKSGWQKLARAFNANTQIVDRELQRTSTGRVREAYYRIKATLPNGRTVESDALCSRKEKGKENASDHTIMSTAKTRATNRAIAELIGAGEVSAEEMKADNKPVENKSKFAKEGDD